MMKHYLLTFNVDYADEHNVPALACFTEEEFEKWKKTPSGVLNKNYEEESKKFKDFTFAKKQLDEKIKEVLGEGWGSIPFTEWPNGLFAEYDGLAELFGYKSHWPCRPDKLKTSGIHANLGNSGDGFEDPFMDLYLMEEFINAKYVKVTEVDKNFHETFHKARLDRLSLCNIFTCDFYFDENED